MNNKFLIILGDKNISSWSLRAWLMLKQVGVQFDELIVKLGSNNTQSEILKYSPSGKVPVLIHSSNVIWESLAIAEYLNEQFPAAQLWPKESIPRSIARSISNEMHAGFMTIRKMMPFSLNQSGEMQFSVDLNIEIKRIEKILMECISKYSKPGGYLFNSFGAADAMFAPVVIRFKKYNYQSKIPEVIDYCETILNNNFIKEWIAP